MTARGSEDSHCKKQHDKSFTEKGFRETKFKDSVINKFNNNSLDKPEVGFSTNQATLNKLEIKKIDDCLHELRLFICSENGSLTPDERGLIISQRLSKIMRLVNKLPSEKREDYKKKIKLIRSAPKRIERSRLTQNLFIHPVLLSNKQSGNYWCYRRLIGKRGSVKLILFKRIRREDIPQIKSFMGQLPKGKFILGRAYSRNKPKQTVYLH